MALADDIEFALAAAPESRIDPSIAVTAAMSGGNVQQNAQVTAHLMNTQATHSALDKVAAKKGGRGVLGATLGWLGGGVKGAMDLAGDGISTTLKVASKPLEQVQQEYRFLRDVQDRHGFAAALMASLPMAVGGVAGGFVGGHYGAAAGIAAGGWVAESLGLQYEDSWKRVSEGEKYLDSSGQHVSPGRDAARFLGSLTKHIGVNIEQQKGFDLYDAVSGIGDGIFDIAADPLTAVAGYRKAAITTGAPGIMAARWSGTALTKGTDVARVTAQYGSVKRGLERLATMDAGEIIARNKKLAPFADELGKADTWEKVGQVLKDNADAAQMRLKYLPRAPIANLPFGELVTHFHAAATDLSLKATPEDAGLIAKKATSAARRVGETYKRVTTFVPTSFNETTGALSRETLYFNDPNSTRTIFDMAKWGHTEGMAKAVAKDWASADVDRRMNIFRNVMTDNMANRMEAVTPGWTQTAEGSEVLARIGDIVDTAFGGIDAGKTTAWGYDAEGRIISKMPTELGTRSLPVLEFQHYNVPMPDYLTFDRNLKALGNGSATFGKVDDFLYDHFTKTVFKRWALLSGGFAIRNAAADAIPFIARDPLKFAKGKLVASLQKHGWDLAEGEEEHLLASITRFVADKGDISQDDLDFLVHNTKSLNGHLAPPSVMAGGEHGIEIVGVEQYIQDTVYSLEKEVPRSVRVTEQDQAWKGDHDGHELAWMKQAQDLAEKSPGSKAGAKAFHEAMFPAGATTPAVSVEEATRRAVAAAKEAIDSLPEDVLNQHSRHFRGALKDDQLVGAAVATHEPKWIPGKKGQPGRFEATGEDVLIGQSTVQKALPYVESGAEPAVFRGGTQYGEINGPFGATRPKEKFVPGTPDIPATTQQAFPELGPQFVEQPALPGVLLDDPHLEWAQVMVENLKGTVMGADGTVHADLLGAIGRGEVFDPNLLKEIPLEQRPHKIMGAYEKPAAPKRFTDRIFSKLNTFMNWTAREPIYQAEVLDQWNGTYKALVESGAMTLDEATIAVNTRAVNAILPHIDNSMERTLMAEHARNWIPFYAAQQQAYARVFRLMAEDPLAFRRVQLGFTQMANFGGIYDDENNNSHFVLPGVGWLTGGATSAMGSLGIPVVGSMPTAFSGNLRSLASVSPVLEGGEFFKPGPLVAIGVRAVNNLLPESTKLTDPIMGDMAHVNSMWEMLVPNATARNLMNAFINDDNRTMAKSTLDAIQALEYKQNLAMRKWTEAGKSPDDPDAPHYVPGPGATDMERQQFIDRVKNHSRILSIFKAVVGSVSPVAPSLQLGELGLKTELYDSIQEKGIGVAIQEFLTKNPDATPYTVFQTEAGTPSPIDSTHQAQQWVEGNMSFVLDKRYSQAASYFIPQTNDKFNQDVYNEQMAMGLRFKKSPEQLIKDIQVAEGNRWYFDTYKPAKDAAVKRARSPQERKQISSQFTKNGDAGRGIVPFDVMKAQNPIWYTNFSSGGRDAERQLALAQMRAAIQQGAAPASPMTEKLADLLKDLDRHNERMLPGRVDAYAAAQRRSENAQWQDYLRTEAERTPELTMAINNIFRGA